MAPGLNMPISLDELRVTAAPQEELESAMLARMPQMSGVPFVRSIKVSSKAGMASGMAQRKASRTITIQATCECAGCGALRPQPIVEESGKLATLELLEAAIQAKVQARMLEHESCHRAAMQRQYDSSDPGGAEGVASDLLGACETESDAESELADDVGSLARRQRRDVCSGCVMCPNHKRLETVEEARRVQSLDPQCFDELDIEANRMQRHRALHDSRHGMIGAVQYWARVSVTKAVSLLVLVMTHFGVVDLILQKLLQADTPLARQIHTREYIVGRARDGLEILKQCSSERQREEYHIALGLIAPKPVAVRDHAGMGRRVAQELQLQQNRLPWQRSVAQRAAADAAWLKRSEPLAAGKAAVSHGRDCTIIDIDHAKRTCTIDCTAGGVSGSRTFTNLGKEKGGARLSRPAITLRPVVAVRKTRRDAKGEEARADVEALFDAEGARSPSMKDEVRRRHGVGLYEKAQALILYSTYAALYAMFLVQYPAPKISFPLFKALRPWYVRRAKREVCQCKHCENFRLHMEVLDALPALFEPVINPPTADQDVDGESATAGGQCTRSLPCKSSSFLVVRPVGGVLGVALLLICAGARIHRHSARLPTTITACLRARPPFTQMDLLQLLLLHQHQQTTGRARSASSA
jgi:hypothetical protein